MAEVEWKSFRKEIRTQVRILTILIGTFILICTLLVDAQVIIPKIGASISRINDNTSQKSRLGFSFGAGYNIKINDVFSIQPELLFIQKGKSLNIHELIYEFDTQVGAYDDSGDLLINYLEVPVLINVKLLDNKTVNIYAYAGPSLGVGLGGKMNNDLSIDYYGNTTTNNETGKVVFGEEPSNYQGDDAYINHRIDVGAQLGSSLMIKEKFIFDLRFGIGLTDLDNEERSKNQCFQLTFGIPIHLK